jgi:hypothetical protein
MSLSDMRLAGQALKERWPMPAERLVALVDRVAERAEAPDAKPRERLAATRVLLQVAKLNLEAIEVAGRSDYGEALRELELLRQEMSRGQGQQLGSGPAGDCQPEGVAGDGPRPGELG